MVKYYSRKLALLVLVVCSCSGPLFFSQTTFGSPRTTPALGQKAVRLQLEVTSGSERVEGAKVILQSDEEGVEFTKEMRTDREGVVRVSAVPPGKLRVLVIARDHLTFGEIIKVNQDNQTHKISLTKRE